MPGELTSYRSLDVGKRYRVIKSFDHIVPGDILDLVNVVYSHYDDLHVISFTKPGVEGNYLTLIAVPEEDHALLDNVSEYLRHVGATPESTTGAGTTQVTSPPSKRDITYAVHIEENSHYRDGSSPIPGGDYASYAKALRATKRIVDRSLAELHQKGMSADNLYHSYTLFGDDPYIVPDDGDPSFSAWSYARERCPVICEEG